MEGIKSARVGKEQRILAVMEPVTQSHRLVVNQAVLHWDLRSLAAIDGAESRHRYALGYQYSHLTKERDCLGHDDRLEAIAGACGQFAELLGVDPEGLSAQRKAEREEDELDKLFGDAESEYGLPHPNGKAADGRANSMKPQERR